MINSGALLQSARGRCSVEIYKGNIKSACNQRAAKLQAVPRCSENMIITVSDRPVPTDELLFARERKAALNATLKATQIHAIMNANVIPRWLMSLSGGSFEEPKRGKPLQREYPRHDIKHSNGQIRFKRRRDFSCRVQSSI